MIDVSTWPTCESPPLLCPPLLCPPDTLELAGPSGATRQRWQPGSVELGDFEVASVDAGSVDAGTQMSSTELCASRELREKLNNAHASPRKSAADRNHSTATGR